jgi:hypothetical protein
MDPEKTQISTEYRLHLELPRTGVVADFRGDDPEVLKENCNRLLNGGCEFLSAPGNAGSRVILIFHPTMWNGRRKIGHLSSTEIPEDATARALTEEQVA